MQEYFRDLDKVSLATSYFDLKEYDRAAHVVRDLKNPLPYFLHMYAEFLAEETRRLDNTSDSVGVCWFGFFLKVATSAVYSEFKITISSHQTSMWLNIYHITVNKTTYCIFLFK